MHSIMEENICFLFSDRNQNVNEYAKKVYYYMKSLNMKVYYTYCVYVL